MSEIVQSGDLDAAETTVYKGEVTRMSDLPIEPEIGDVYKVSGKTVFFDGCWNEIASSE